MRRVFVHGVTSTAFMIDRAGDNYNYGHMHLTLNKPLI